MLGVPLAWAKIHGGTTLAWIGFAVDLNTLALGISESRAAWAVEWLERLARDGCADMDEFRAATGRLAFVAGALEYERPFLAPLFTFSSLVKRGGSGSYRCTCAWC